jgi:thioredoxin reductase (NADPH)
VIDFLNKFIPNVGGYGIYVLAALAAWAVYGFIYRTPDKIVADDNSDFAAFVPPSLHPIVDPAICIGCGACVSACPEGQIIGLVGGKAELIDAASCIGHGACKTSCPTNAIELVFGSAKRGVDIPNVAPDFQSNIPGIYIAGELGGMGLIANAIEQGCQAIEAISKREGLQQPNVLDVVIVGGGPAGFGASLAAKERHLRTVTLEQGSLGGTVAHYPRDKVVMTRPARLPLYGTFKARRVRKEKLLEVWQSVIKKTGIRIQFGERVERVFPKPWGFEVETHKERYLTRTVLLATGRRGAPRKLDVPGEDLPKVAYSLTDATQYQGKDVLVVGGGNSAVEAAAELSQQSDGNVTLIHRGQSFERVNQQNRKWLEEADVKQRLKIILKASVTMIHADRVEIEVDGQRHELKNDVVIVCVGGLMPMALLGQIGVEVATKYGTS